MKLVEKVVLITGAARGIGKTIAIEMIKEGAQVVLTDVQEKDLVEICSEKGKEINRGAYAGRSVYRKMDVTNSTEVERVITDTVNKFGRIDVVVNCAGVLSSSPIYDLDEKEWDRIHRVNLKGTFLVIKAAAKYMIQQRTGAIINVASDSGKTGKKFLSHYCSSKFGVIGLTQSAARDLGEFNIMVNAVCPGPTISDMYYETREAESKLRGVAIEEVINEENKLITLGRAGNPDEIARLVVFLVSDDNTYITGEAINISGGFEVH